MRSRPWHAVPAAPPRRLSKVERVLGSEGAVNPVTPRARRSSRDERVWPSKALKVLGITVDEMQMDKALRVLGEHPFQREAHTMG